MGLLFGWGLGVQTIKDNWYAELVLFIITMSAISIIILDITLDRYFPLDNTRCSQCGTLKMD